MHSYYEFVKQSAGFPQSDFDVFEDELYFHNINLMEMIETYGTPLKFTFLPAISNKIKEARLLFQQAMLKNDYRGRYHHENPVIICSTANYYNSFLLMA
jgi:arginine decarboxylase